MALRVVVAGAGARGRVWARELGQHQGCELGACVDVDPATLDEATGELSVPGFASLPEALDAVACDAVIVATPPADHAESCRLALEGGVAVLVEKPFTERLVEAAELVALAEERSLPLLVGQNYRYMRSVRTVRRLVREGALGHVHSVTAHYYRIPHILSPYKYALDDTVLWGPGIHHLDALRWSLGQDAVAVMAQRYKAPGSDLKDGASMQVLLELERGTRVVYSATYESSGHEFFERGQEFYERLIGDRATLHVFQRWLFLCEGRKLPRPIRRGPRPVTEESILLTQLERAVVHGEEPDASGRANLPTMAMLEACVRSADERRWLAPAELMHAAL
ncbi:MAG: Gfo/Idh/MocA family protein [Thermoleophilaceae bacterium]